jgi:hypothetical protein
MPDLRPYGQVAYDAYSADAGHKSVHGEALPDWHSSSPEVRTHWRASAEALRHRIMTDIAAGRNPAEAG